MIDDSAKARVRAGLMHHAGYRLILAELEQEIAARESVMAGLTTSAQQRQEAFEQWRALKIAHQWLHDKPRAAASEIDSDMSTWDLIEPIDHSLLVDNRG